MQTIVVAMPQPTSVATQDTETQSYPRSMFDGPNYFSFSTGQEFSSHSQGSSPTTTSPVESVPSDSLTTPPEGNKRPALSDSEQPSKRQKMPATSSPGLEAKTSVHPREWRSLKTRKEVSDYAMSSNEVRSMANYLVDTCVAEGKLPVFGKEAEDLIASTDQPRAFAGFYRKTPNRREFEKWKSVLKSCDPKELPVLHQKRNGSAKKIPLRSLMNIKISEHWSYKAKSLYKLLSFRKTRDPLSRQELNDARVVRALYQWARVPPLELNQEHVTLAVWRVNKKFHGRTLRDDVQESRCRVRGRRSDLTEFELARDLWREELLNVKESLFPSGNIADLNSGKQALLMAPQNEEECAALQKNQSQMKVFVNPTPGGGGQQLFQYMPATPLSGTPQLVSLMPQQVVPSMMQPQGSIAPHVAWQQQQQQQQQSSPLPQPVLPQQPLQGLHTSMPLHASQAMPTSMPHQTPFPPGLQYQIMQQPVHQTLPLQYQPQESPQPSDLPVFASKSHFPHVSLPGFSAPHPASAPSLAIPDASSYSSMGSYEAHPSQLSPSHPDTDTMPKSLPETDDMKSLDFLDGIKASGASEPLAFSPTVDGWSWEPQPFVTEIGTSFSLGSPGEFYLASSP